MYSKLHSKPCTCSRLISELFSIEKHLSLRHSWTVLMESTCGWSWKLKKRVMCSVRCNSYSQTRKKRLALLNFFLSLRLENGIIMMFRGACKFQVKWSKAGEWEKGRGDSIKAEKLCDRTMRYELQNAFDCKMRSGSNMADDECGRQCNDKYHKGRIKADFKVRGGLVSEVMHGRMTKGW